MTNNDDVKARMLAALEAKKGKKGAPGTAHQEHRTMQKAVPRFVVVNAAAAPHKFSAKLDHLVQDLLVNF